MSTPAPVRARQSFRHEAFLWHGRREFAGRLAPFIREGIDADEAVMVAVTPEHAEWLRSELGPSAGEVKFVDMTELGRNPACIIPAWQAFLDECSGDGRPARGIGEPIWVGRRPEEIVECQLHEALLNLAVDPDLPFWLMCPYDEERLDSEVIVEAGRSHPVLAQATSYTGSPNYLGHAHAQALFSAELPALSAEPAEITVTHQTNQECVVAYAVLHASAAGAWSHEVIGLTRTVRELTSSSLDRGADAVRIRFWSGNEVLVCDVTDCTVTSDLLIGRRSAPSAYDSLWAANHAFDLVQARSSQKGTTVRLHLRTSPPRRLSRRVSSPTRSDRALAGWPA